MTYPLIPKSTKSLVPGQSLDCPNVRWPLRVWSRTATWWRRKPIARTRLLWRPSRLGGYRSPYGRLAPWVAIHPIRIDAPLKRLLNRVAHSSVYAGWTRTTSSCRSSYLLWAGQEPRSFVAPHMFEMPIPTSGVRFRYLDIGAPIHRDARRSPSRGKGCHNNALERSVRSLASGAAGARRIVAPAAPGRALPRPAQRER